jgi:energy-coupling factor transport system ATP-binding protein
VAPEGGRPARGEGARSGGLLLVCCEGVTYSYPGSSRPAIDRLDLRVSAGEYVGVLGPNGSGKSTLARLLNGLLRADSGRVLVAGYDPAEEPWEVRRRLGVLFQNPDNQLLAPFVEDDVAFGLENLGVSREEMRGRVRAALEAVGLSGFERREPHTLSGGEKQRVALAGILAVEPEVLVLDEPTSMLDAAGRREVLERISALRGERTVVHITHHLDEILDADRVLILNGGRLVAELAPEELVREPELLRENRLVLPPVLRLAAALGLGFCRTPEELARAIAGQRVW